ncbi:conserved hypothetical protein [Paraburkholderia piptadeniae]|uniref:Uncharacterized protein n=1 Tax=Paraburkholderia piptadeniae TaxID=1701573 RepID=A0A1N7SRY7_9BURK|nr:conserved hypothetical protein [Paraburkholderia piptadeniae]
MSADPRNSRWYIRIGSGWCVWLKHLTRLHILVLVSYAVPSMAGWIDQNGKPIADRQDAKSFVAFGVMLVLTADEAAFMRAWNSHAQRPNLQTTKSMQRGKSVSAMLLFSGCTPNAAGTCNVSVRYRLAGPDGTVQDIGPYNVWQRVAPKPGIVELGDSRLAIRVAKNDPTGNYSVSATLMDLNSKTSIAVSTTVTVTD